MKRIETKDERLFDIFPHFQQWLEKWNQEHSTILMGIERKKRMKMLLYICAVCHNINWEYLCTQFIQKLDSWSSGLDEAKLMSIEERDVEAFFLTYPKKHKVDAKRRAKMIRMLATELAKRESFFDQISNASSLIGEKGVLSILNALPVFSEDPLHKKSNLFAQLLIDLDIVHVDDEERIEPLVDYHIIRLYLRTGRIRVLDETLKQKLMARQVVTVEEVTSLRFEIAEQIKRFCVKYNKKISELNTIDWNVAREHCTTEKIYCTEGCILSEYCDSYGKGLREMLIEPICDHGFY